MKQKFKLNEEKTGYESEFFDRKTNTVKKIFFHKRNTFLLKPIEECTRFSCITSNKFVYTENSFFETPNGIESRAIIRETSTNFKNVWSGQMYFKTVNILK